MHQYEICTLMNHDTSTFRQFVPSAAVAKLLGWVQGPGLLSSEYWGVTTPVTDIT
jgi:hypothetical protein